MLDVRTRQRIDTARDILVGKVPDPKSQVEQITLALMYKFMGDMDAQSEEYGGKATFFAGRFRALFVAEDCRTWDWSVRCVESLLRGDDSDGREPGVAGVVPVDVQQCLSAVS